MMFEDFIAAFADALGVTETNGAIMLSLLITLFCVIMVNIGKRKTEPFITITIGLVASIGFTVVGWYPIIVGAAIAMIFALMFAWYVSKVGGH